MTYFLVLPVVGVLVLLLGGFTVACRVAPSLRPLFPFAGRILVWATAGVVAAHGAVLLLYLVPAFAPEELASDQGARGLLKIFLAAGLLVAPLVASALGFMAGSTFGVFMALRSLREQGNDRRAVAAGAGKKRGAW